MGSSPLVRILLPEEFHGSGDLHGKLNFRTFGGDVGHDTWSYEHVWATSCRADGYITVVVIILHRMCVAVPIGNT